MYVKLRLLGLTFLVSDVETTDGNTYVFAQPKAIRFETYLKFGRVVLNEPFDARQAVVIVGLARPEL